MSAVDLLKQATRRVCEERGDPWPDDADAEFDDPSVARFADVIAELVLAEHTAELEREAALMRARMERLEAALDEWASKTDWAQKSAQVHELGLHRADVLRTRIERLQGERDGIVQAIIQRLESACGQSGMPPNLIRREFMPERPCVVHVQPDDTEGGAL